MRKITPVDIRRPSDRHGHWSRMNMRTIMRATVGRSLRLGSGDKVFTLTLAFHGVLTLDS